MNETFRKAKADYIKAEADSRKERKLLLDYAKHVIALQAQIQLNLDYLKPTFKRVDLDNSMCIKKWEDFI